MPAESAASSTRTITLSAIKASINTTQYNLTIGVTAVRHFSEALSKKTVGVTIVI